MRSSVLFRGAALITATATAAFVLAGCTPDSSGGGGDDPIVIGASLPLTGEFSQGGLDTQQGYEVWVELTNEAGGLLDRPVEIVIRDDATNQNSVVTNYNALIDEDEVDLLLGTQSSLLNIPGSAVAEQAGMVYICPSCGSPDMYNRGFEYIFFAQQALAANQGEVFARWIASLPEDQRPTTAAYPTLDDPFARPVVEGAEAILAEAGIETVYRDVYPATTENFDAIVNAIVASGAELVVQGSQFEDGVNMVLAMDRAGFQPEIFYQSSSPAYGQQYVDGIGGAEAAEGVMFSTSYHVDGQTFGNAEFVAKYQEMFDGPIPPEDAADGFAAAQVLAAAVEAVGSVDDQAALAEWLHANQVDTLLGPLSWNADGSPTGEFLIGQWQGGESQVVLPEAAATTDVIIRWRGTAF